jgi:YD repeat-containing protein
MKALDWRFSWRSWLAMRAPTCLLVLMLACATHVAGASADGPAGAEGPDYGGALSAQLVIPSIDQLLGGQQTAAALVERRNDPVAVAARAVSRWRLEGLPASQTARLAKVAFPGLVAQAAGGVPELPADEHLVRYLKDNAAVVALPGGRGVVESLVPMAVRTHGRYSPLDLRMQDTPVGFVPAHASVGVTASRTLAQGVSLTHLGVSLTPVDRRGVALGASGGTLDGAAVIWRDSDRNNTGVYDLATLAKAVPQGFDLSTLLLSQRSPGEIFFRVGMPAGALLKLDASGTAVVVAHGRTLASIPPASAQDAEGLLVPVSMSVRGDLLELSVKRSGEDLYPIVVDPELNDAQLATTTAGKRSNWEFHTSNAGRFAGSATYEGVGKERLETRGAGEYAPTEWAYWGYQTHGDSKIYEVKTETSAKNRNAKIESFLEFETPGGAQETKKLLSTEVEGTSEYEKKASVLCAANSSKVEECLPGAGAEHNAVHFQQSATASPGGSWGFSDTMTQGIVSISEPTGTHATTAFNTTTAELEFEVEKEGKKEKVKRKNALYGSGGWLTNFAGALGLTASDPGVGVAATKLEREAGAGSWEPVIEHNYLEKENACQGIQCYPTHTEDWTLNSKLPDGEDKIRYKAEEAIPGTQSLESEGLATVKVDTSAPHGLELYGLPYGEELTEKPYKLRAEATDGTGSTIPSSGVKSLALFVSGHEIPEVGKQAGCIVAKGECTASAEWTLNGAELGAGHHAIVIVATDNAGNESRLSETISIHHSTPVSLGPGSVDLQSGDFSLGATDASLGGGLTVSRNYSSRATEEGGAGPFGAQWSLSLASSQSLTELVDKSMLLTEADGTQAIFASRGDGTYEAPIGDSNLKLTLEENKTTKEKLAYHLEDAAKDTRIKFTLPAGDTNVWEPAAQEGPVASDAVTYNYRTGEEDNEFALPANSEPWGIVGGPDKRMWFTDYATSKIGAITEAGTVTEYPLPAESEPRGITEGPDGKMWFVDWWTFKIGKISTKGTITEYSLSGEGRPEDIVAGPDGNLWFTTSTNKIGKITTSGAITQYPLPSGHWAKGITVGPDGNLWFVEPGANRIGKMTTAGALTEYAVPAESSPQSITTGPDGNLWFVDWQSSKIGKITLSGSVTEYALAAGREPTEITAGPDGNLWFTGYSVSKASIIGKITPAGAVTEYHGGYLSKQGIATGFNGQLWFTDGKAIGEIPTTGDYVTEPTRALAPPPPGVSCTSELKPGCRALEFSYYPSELKEGEYWEWKADKGHLASITYDAYNPSSKTMQKQVVAEYSYDQQGRLVGAWDPRYGSSPRLQTTYGYDGEGHLTALDPPGQQPWLFTYGAKEGDTGTGRLLKAMQPPAGTSLWNGEAVKSGGTPVISGTPVVGTRMAVSNGSWSGSPLAYSYQWQDCNGTGEACTAIAGATNANYTASKADAGHILAATVTATNGGGSAPQTAYATAVVAEPNFAVSEYALPAGSKPYGITSGPDGNLWFTDSGTDKVGKITSAGAATEYATDPDEPRAIAAGPDGNLWFVEHSVRNVNHMSTTGALTVFKLTRTSTYNQGIAAGPDGNVWFTESEAGYIGKINTHDEVLAEYKLPSGSLPYGIAAGPDGNLWFTDYGTSKIGKVTTAGEITEYALPTGSKPWGIVAGSDGNLWFTDSGTGKVGKISRTGSITEYALPSGSAPLGMAAGSDGNLWVAESGTSRVARVMTSGAITEFALASGSTPYGIASGPEGTMWVTEFGSSKIAKLTPTSATQGEYHTPQPGTTLEYGVALSGAGVPAMTGAEVAAWGQKDDPSEATAIVPPDSPQGWPASSYSRATFYYLDSHGRQVNVARPSNAAFGSVATTEYNETNDVIRTLSAANRQRVLEAGAGSVELSRKLDTQYTYNGEGAKEGEVEEPGTRLIETLGPQHEVRYVAGKEQKESLAREHKKLFYDEGAPGGEVHDLLTKETALAQLANEEEVEVRKTSMSYSGQSNLGWTLRAPTSVTTDPENLAITHSTLYEPATGQVTETRGAAGGAGESAHDARYVYYSAAANGSYPECGGHSEWGGLLCEKLPAKQPETAGLPKLSVTTVASYNMLDEPLVTTEAFGSTVRTKTDTYDSAGRLTGSETTSTANTPLPKVTDSYNPNTGLLETESTTVEGKAQTITIKHNTLGQLTEYVDADGNTAKYTYGTPEADGLITEMTDGGAGGTAKQTYSYDPTTKLMTKLTDSSAGTFTAAYDAEGRMTSEVYPDGLCANYTYNSAGTATHLEYIKTTNCAEGSPTVWYSETVSPSVHGEALSRTSTLASERYSYDGAGRLTETQETPSGEGCTTRIYAYDVESNRTGLTTRAPGSKGECATEGGTTQSHSYDEANRLIDSGTAYDSFGNVTKVPAADAEGHELASTFYVDNAVATQSQNGTTTSYSLDPDGRVREAISGGVATVEHYDAPGEAVSWTSESGGHWTRNIPGIGGSLAATQANGETPVLQLPDLDGSIVATAELSPAATKLLSTYNSTEFGVPNGGKAPPKYGWLGADGVASALPSGVITYGATSYVPQLGRALQGEAVEPPGLSEGSGSHGVYVAQEEAWNLQGAAREGGEAPGLEAGRERAAMEAAIQAAKVIDPSETMNRKRARALGETYLKLATAAEVASLFDIPGDIIELIGGEFGASLGLDNAFPWLRRSAEKLIKCAGNNRSDALGSPLNICNIAYAEISVELFGHTVAQFIDFGVESKVYECEESSLLPGVPVCLFEVHIPPSPLQE